MSAMDVREALYTTRAMRRLRPDPIPEPVVQRILDAAVRAPSGGNEQRFRLLTVQDRATIAQVGELYRAALAELNATRYAGLQERLATGDPADPAIAQAARVSASARHLADHFDAVPLLLFAYGAAGGGSSVFPAVWSACLAARAEGVGSTVTTLLKLRKAEVDRLLGVPGDGRWQYMATVPFGYPTGRWGVAARRPLHELVYAERWGSPPQWRVDGPLWLPTGESKGDA